MSDKEKETFQKNNDPLDKEKEIFPASEFTSVLEAAHSAHDEAKASMGSKEAGYLDKEKEPFQKNNNPQVKKKKKIKCHHCNAKLGMIIFECKCGYNFCSAHLNAHSHNCTFDYINERKKEIAKNNPKIGEKFVCI